MKQQPGVMLYFDVRDSIAQLTYEEKGMLLDAILDYGQHRQEPMFDGVALPLIWPFVRKDIHRDSERYEEIRAKRQAAAAKRWQISEDTMQEDANASKCIQVECKPMQNMPTTSSPSSPSLNVFLTLKYFCISLPCFISSISLFIDNFFFFLKKLNI